MLSISTFLMYCTFQSPTKVLEPEVDIRLMLVECVHLLCQRRIVRDEMRAKKVYPIIRNLSLNQDDDRVNEAVIDIVNLLMRDEDPSNID